MSQYKKYPKYKQARVEWLDRVPENWAVTRLANIGVFSSSGVDKKTVEGESLVSMINYTDVYGNKERTLTKERDYMVVSCPENKKREHQVQYGDLIFTPSSETIEDIGLSALVDDKFENTVFSYHVVRFAFSKKLYHEYKKYLCNNLFVLNQFSKRAKGTTRQILGRFDFRSIRIVLPTYQEQERIAEFLDKKTARIDELIDKKQKMIELLKEKRSAIINQAVTCGLDKNGKLRQKPKCLPAKGWKPSGIDWIGDIPEGWEVKKIRYLGRFQNGVSKDAEYFGSGYPFLSYGDVYNNVVIPKSLKGLAQSSDDERIAMSVEKGDVFFTRTSETIEEIGIASTCLKTVTNAIFSGFLIRFRPCKKQIWDGFSKYYFRSSVVQKFFTREMNIVTRASLAQELLKRLPVLIPDIDEQMKIANFLEEKMEGIDKLIKGIQGAIEKLQEYRAAIITAAVTGKIDVTGVN